MGGARRAAVGRTPALSGEQQTSHLAALQSAKERNSRLFSAHYFLIPTCVTCFEQDTLLILLFTFTKS